MAVAIVPQTCSLRLVVEAGINASGQPLYKHRDFKGVKTTAGQDDLYAVALALSSLSAEALTRVERLDAGILEQD